MPTLLLGDIPGDDRSANDLAPGVQNGRSRDADREHGAALTQVLCFEEWKGRASQNRCHVPQRVRAPAGRGQFPCRMAQNLLRRITVKPLRRRIPGLDGSLQIQRHNGVVRTQHDGGQPRPRFLGLLGAGDIPQCADPSAIALRSAAIRIIPDRAVRVYQAVLFLKSLAVCPAPLDSRHHSLTVVRVDRARPGIYRSQAAWKRFRTVDHGLACGQIRVVNANPGALGGDAKSLFRPAQRGFHALAFGDVFFYGEVVHRLWNSPRHSPV